MQPENLRNLFNSLISSPQDVQYLFDIASGFRELGEFDKANRALELLLELEPSNAESIYWLSMQNKSIIGTDIASQIEASLTKNTYGSNELSYIYFAAARLREQQHCWDDAFAFYERANSFHKQALCLWNTDAVHYLDQCEFAERMDREWRIFIENSSYEEKFSNLVDQGEDLVFIVGLPRCGSTLVETILAMAAESVPLGEVGFLATAIRESNILSVLQADPKDFDLYWRCLAQFADGYREVVTNYPTASDPNSSIFLDKTLINFLYLGLAARVWPKAKFIHVERHPLDQIISAWRARFKEGHYFCLELNALTKVYIAYSKLMEYWHSILGERIYKCIYEDLVSLPDVVTKELAGFCDLDWCAELMEPHSSKRLIKTGSFQQVRQPINASSIGGWRNYENQLKDCILLLNNAGISI